MIGTTLADRYEIVSELGRGGMGVVYRARDPLLNREVAVKLIPPSLLTAESEERFQREAQIVAQMNHPSIVSIFDMGRHEGSLFFLMPVITGTNLRQFLREKPRSLGQVLEIIIEIASALEYSHNMGVIHRDIKPENVMIAEERGALRVYVTDFGLAKASTETRITRTGALVGTVLYFSPEHVSARNIDQRSDIYSLATVLYEALAGEPPFTGDVQSVLYRIVHEHPRPPRSLGAGIGEDLETIIMRSLQKDPARRHQSAGELANDLKKFTAKLKDEERNRSVVLSTEMTAQFNRVSASELIGREEEFTSLQHCLNAAIDGECQFAVVAGDPGIGKTRLLQELETLAGARKIRVLHGRLTEQSRAYPYQGFCELIQDYFRSRDAGTSSSDESVDLSDLAPELISIFPVLSEVSAVREAAAESGDEISNERLKGEDRTYVYELLARTLTRIAGGRPLLLILENLHGAETSLDALQYAIQRLAPTSTLIAASYRKTEVDRGHPLSRMLEGFHDDPRFHLIDLGPLERKEHKRLIESLVGNDVSDPLVERLYGATEGNPFFTKELVRSLLDSDGIVRDDSGAWSLSGEMVLSSEMLPATIQQAVEKRIERLPEEMRELLAVAAVLGKTFDFEDLEFLADDVTGLDRMVDRLIAEAILEEDRASRGDRLAFSSGIVRDALYGTLSRRRRRSLHRRYAEYIEKKNEGRLERFFPQLLHHYSEGDVPEKSVEYGIAQARRSLDSFSPGEALDAIRIVLEFARDDDWDRPPGIEGDARLLRVDAYRRQGNVDLALQEADTAWGVLEKESDSERALEISVLAAETAWQGRRVEEARRWFEQGIETARRVGDRERLVKLLSLGATVANLRGEYEKAKLYLDEAEQMSAGEETSKGVEDTPTGGVFRSPVTNIINTAEPSQLNTDEDAEILGLAFETLVATDEQGHLVPSLCESWEVLPGGTALRFRLVEGISFADGQRLDSAAVKSSFERALRSRSDKVPSALELIEGSEDYRERKTDALTGISIVDDRTFEIRIREQLPIYPAMLTDPATAIAHHGSDDDGDVSGTGPFRISERKSDRIVLDRNPGWRGEPARVDSIEFLLMKRSAEIAEAFRSGRIDLARDLSQSELDSMLRNPGLRPSLLESPKKNTYFILFNVNGPAAGNESLRKALSRVLRVHEIVWRDLGRLAQPAAGLIPPSIFGHDHGRRRVMMSIEQAGELVSSLDQKPVRLVASAHPLFIDRYNSLTEIILDRWREIGVEVEIRISTTEAYLDSFLANEELDLIFTRWNSDYDDPDNFTHGLFESENGVFRNFFSSKESDELLRKARIETSLEERESLYRTFETNLITSGVVVPLFHEINSRLSSHRVRGIELRTSRPYLNYTSLGVAERSEPVLPSIAGGGTIHVPIIEDVQSIDPAEIITLNDNEVLSNVFETLTLSEEGARVVPWLAESLRPEDGGRRWWIRLRDNVRFHDGRRMSARDVRFSWERSLAMGERTALRSLSSVRGAKALAQGDTDALEGLKIVSPLELSVELDHPLAFFPALISDSPAAVVPEGTRTIEGNWRDGCIGTGPFRVVQFESRRRLELERNPDYWRAGFPRSESLVFHFGLTPEEIGAGFKRGDLSIAVDLYPETVEELRHDPRFAGGYREIPRLSTYYVAFNRHSEKLGDVETRRELIRGVDIVSLVRGTIGRLAMPASGIIPPGLPGFGARTRDLGGTANPDALKDLELTAAIAPVFFGQYEALAKELRDRLSRRGVKIKVETQTNQEYLRLAKTRNVDITIGRWVADYPDSDTFAFGLLHTEEGFIGHLCGTDELDELIHEARGEPDPAARHAIYRQMEEIVARDVLVLPLFHEQIYRFARPEVEGLRLRFAAPEVAYENLRVTR